MRDNIMNFNLPVDLFNNVEHLYDHWADGYPDIKLWRNGIPGVQAGPPLVPKYHYVFHFPNGYGASVIKGPGTYGYEEDLWELGVLSERDGGWHLDYDTDITCDVEGCLSVEDVKKLLDEIKHL